MIPVKQLVEDAVDLLGSGTSPARCRTVASRAYYAAFHACLDAAQHAGYRFRHGKGGTHQQLLGFLRSGRPGPLKRAGLRLQRLYDQRIEADYRRDIAMGQGDAAMAVEDMSEIIEILESA